MQVIHRVLNTAYVRCTAAWPLAALLLPIVLVPAAAQRPPGAVQMAVAGPSSDAVADYRRRLADYLAARESFEADAKAYWTAITEKRRGRNTKRREGQPITLDDYVLEQPPVYSGPKRPVDPSPPESSGPRRPSKTMPVVADFLKAAADHFHFVPERADELAFKKAYARAASAEGINRETAVRVYAFETGGNGRFDMQSGLNSSKPNARAISTAVGYNQLLTTNTSNLLAEQGDRIMRALHEKAARSTGPARAAMDKKIAAVKRMIAYSRSIPNEWSQHEKLTSSAPGWGLHALVLDIDVGPLLQTHKLLTSVQFARMKGYTRPLTAAELEMMNLTGDSTGLDMVMMPQSMRLQVPTSNFFQRSGYERNPVAIRNNTVARLLAATDAQMDSGSQLPGARDLAAAF